MLAPDERSILRDLLRPPVDHRLDIAVATSFTLDLSSALVAPLAFASYEIDGPGDPVALLEAVRSAADRVTIFSQVGYLRIPRVASDVMAFLEPMVHEVAAPHPGYLFHPKVWVLRYRDLDDEPSYRLVCGTRNLTPDTSWDAVVALDGWIETDRPTKKNRPLVDLVSSLPDLSIRPVSDERRVAIDELADELATVTWELPAGARDVDFHVLGLDRPGGPRLWDSVLGTRNLVVSPFLDDETIRWFRDESTELTVVSRPEALELLEAETVKELQCRILDPLAAITDGSTSDEATATDARHDPVASTPALGSDSGPALDSLAVLGGLHAKVYVAETRASVRLVIGSSNATGAGIDDGNVEFLVEFEGHRKEFGIDRLLGTDDEFGSLLNDYTPTGGKEPDPADDAGRQLENLVRVVASRRYLSTVTPHEDGWVQRVTTDLPVDVPDDVRLTIGLLTLAGTVTEHAAGPIDAPFNILAMADITPFVCLRAEQHVAGQRIERSTVVRSELHGDPAGRLDEVLARQVDTPEKFLQFLMLLLALGDGRPAPLPDGTGSGESWAFGQIGRQGVLESLVSALAEQPRVLDDLDRLVTRLRSTESGAKVLPPGFDTLWSAVLDAKATLEVGQ